MSSLLETIGDARIVDLSQPMANGMPQSPNHPPFRMTLERRHGDMHRSDGTSAANELIITGGHVGTHVDALAHLSLDGRVYGGAEAAGLQSNRGFASLGIDDFAPFVGRAVLLDVPAVHGVPSLPPGYEVTPDDLEEAVRHGGVEPTPGDAILVGTGWSRRWSERDVFIGAADGVPGPGEAAGQWLADRQPRLVGAESIAFEHLAPGKGHALLPVHRIMLVERGINIVETMRLFPLLDEGIAEFVLMLSPLNIVGATGAPARPLALLS